MDDHSRTAYGSIAGGRKRDVDDGPYPEATQQTVGPWPSVVIECEIDERTHMERARASREAAAFLRANPAFQEFIRLIRSGAIRL